MLQRSVPLNMLLRWPLINPPEEEQALVLAQKFTEGENTERMEALGIHQDVGEVLCRVQQESGNK